MKTLTVQEASRNLSELLHSAADGEEITICDGMLDNIAPIGFFPAKR